MSDRPREGFDTHGVFKVQITGFGDRLPVTLSVNTSAPVPCWLHPHHRSTIFSRMISESIVDGLQRLAGAGATSTSPVHVTSFPAAALCTGNRQHQIFTLFSTPRGISRPAVGPRSYFQ